MAGFFSLVLPDTSVVNLDTYTTYILGAPGAGMGPLDNISTPYGLGDGALYQRTIAAPRQFSLIVRTTGTSWSNLHTMRQSLINALKPDRQATAAPVEIRYSGGSTTLALFAYYEGGLESAGEWDGFTEQITLRFTAYDPYWYGLTSSTPSLTVQTSVTNANEVLQRSSTGTWAAMGTGANGNVYALALGSDGTTIYAGGAFTSMGGVANTNRIAKWSGGAWTALGTGMNGDVRALAVGPDGSLYAAGDFTLAGGVANTVRIAKWNGSAWSALSTGITGGTVYALAFGLDGSLYAAGDFTLAGGVANTVRIAKWNGSAWSALSTGINAFVLALVVGPDGSLYAGGGFTVAGGVLVEGIAKWNGSAWSQLGTILGDNISVTSIWALAFGPDGLLYAGGDLTTGSPATTGIAAWNGVIWQALGTGLNNIAEALAFDSTGGLYVGGNAFTTAGGVTTPAPLARYYAGTWHPAGDLAPGVSAVSALLVSSTTLTIGGNFSGTITAAGVTTVTNSGTATAYPTVTIALPSAAASRSALYQIVNYTTGDKIYFSYSLLPGETLTLDLSPGAKTLTSSFRGNVIGSILPGSNLATWRLLPGANSVSFFASGSTTTCSLSYKNRHWSFDGSV